METPELPTVFLKCKKCGHGHFAVSREYAEAEVKSFNTYFDSLPKERQESNYGGRKSSVETYESCFRCGTSYKNSVVCKEEDLPLGCTLNPLIQEE